MTDAGVVHVEIELERCSGEVCVNDIPIASCPEPLPRFAQSIPVHQYLVPGVNRLDLWLDIAGPPSASRDPRAHRPAPEATGAARLVRYAPGATATPDEGAVLLRVDWSAAKDDAGTSPRRAGASADLGAAFGRWAWQDAPVLTLDPETVAEAQRLMQAVHAALVSGDAPRLLELIRVRFDEVGRAYPAPRDEDEIAALSAWLAEIAADPSRVLPLDGARHDLRLVADGRIIDCLDRNWRACVRFRELAEGTWVETPYPMQLARIGGALRVVL